MLMLCGVCIQKAADHFLVLRVMLLGLFFEKIHTGFAEPDRHLHLRLFKRQFLWGRESVANHFYLTDGAVTVFYFRFHKFYVLSASIPLRKFGSLIFAT